MSTARSTSKRELKALACRFGGRFHTVICGSSHVEHLLITEENYLKLMRSVVEEFKGAVKQKMATIRELEGDVNEFKNKFQFGELEEEEE